jgi:hypothetical protein
MSRTIISRRVARPVADFLVGLLLFGAFLLPAWMEASKAGGSRLAGAAHARLLEFGLRDHMIGLAAIAAVPAPEPSVVAVVCVGMAFASLFAVNLWFARHVRAAHAAYRRGRA